MSDALKESLKAKLTASRVSKASRDRMLLRRKYHKEKALALALEQRFAAAKAELSQAYEIGALSYAAKDELFAISLAIDIYEKYKDKSCLHDFLERVFGMRNKGSLKDLVRVYSYYLDAKEPRDERSNDISYNELLSINESFFTSYEGALHSRPLVLHSKEELYKLMDRLIDDGFYQGALIYVENLCQLLAGDEEFRRLTNKLALSLQGQGQNP